VAVTVLLALTLAQLDALQTRAPLEPPGLPIINIQATAIAVGRIIPLDLDAIIPPLEATTGPSGPAPEDLNPRPDIITGVSEEGVIFTVCGEVPEGWLLHTVEPGQTLASLAAATQSSAGELAAANCLTDAEVAAGMQLLVPRQPEETLCGPPQWWARYQVRSGDTLGALAANRGTTVDEILRANCRDELDLVAGQFIFLPPGFQTGADVPIPQPSLTPLPPPTDVPTLAPLPTTIAAPTDRPPPPPSPTSVPPSPTVPVDTPVPPTATPPPLPTDPAPTQPPPTLPPPEPTSEPPPTDPPPVPTDPPPVPTDPPPTPEASAPGHLEMVCAVL
jgi:LysM repeat protein